MDSFKIYTESEVRSFVKIRPGEVKIGEVVKIVPSLEDMENTAARYVLMGIPEDIGVRANRGIAGAATAWEPALAAFLNLQSNGLLAGNEVIVLGYFDIDAPQDASEQGLRNKVKAIDQLVLPVIQKIVAAGKVPVIIGGGHNNVFPILAGLSAALQQNLSAVNIDAHADVRAVEEGRHSGNGFSAAIEQGCLARYKVFGLHENYNNAATMSEISSNEKIDAIFFEDLLEENPPLLEQWKAFLEDLPEPCALEIDLDSIQGVLASAATPSGFTLNEVRKMIRFAGKKFASLHICEGAIEMADGRKDFSTAKTIACLVSDFIKAQQTIKQQD